MDWTVDLLLNGMKASARTVRGKEHIIRLTSKRLNQTLQVRARGEAALDIQIQYALHGIDISTPETLVETLKKGVVSHFAWRIKASQRRKTASVPLPLQLAAARAIVVQVDYRSRCPTGIRKRSNPKETGRPSFKTRILDELNATGNGATCNMAAQWTCMEIAEALPIGPGKPKAQATPGTVEDSKSTCHQVSPVKLDTDALEQEASKIDIQAAESEADAHEDDKVDFDFICALLDDANDDKALAF
mmetsp:Transcript_14198/g.36804  ORF Transcript_14198/g.36804 Transcript_14198/m.36804 type:complete len:246 (-) Transcript_14198:173-910(-)